MEDKEHSPTAVSLGRHKRWAPRAKTGCATCRKRKIKCDEARPRCCRCVRAGISCLGYLTDMAPAESSVSLTLSPGSLPQYNGSQDMRDVLLLLPQVNKSAPVPPDDVCRGMRIAVEVVLHDLPRRTGHSVALDKAVICVAATLKEISAQLRTADVDTMTKAQMTLTMSNSYAAALSALRNDLSDPIRSTSAETLFAVQLLCCFESFQESHSETILRHLFGISKILEHRGPHMFTAKPQIDILFQQLPAVTWSSLAYNISNFLCRSSWEALIKPAELSGDGQSRLYLGLHRNAAHVITLLSECTSLIKASRKGERHSVWHISLLQKLKHTRRMFMRWYFRMIDDLSPLDGLSDTVSVLELLYKRTSTRWAFFPLSACQIFCNLILRLPVALGCDNALKVEQQTQEHARNLKTLYLKLEEEDPKFPMPEMEMENIDATLSTADGWWKFAAQADNGRQDDRLSLIPEDTFRNWLQLMEIYC